MLTHLIILLDDNSVSYCHYSVEKRDKRLISLENLQAGILFAMKENLNVQFVYPKYELPEAYLKLIDSIDHAKIMPSGNAQKADIVVLNEITTEVERGIAVVLRVTLAELAQGITTVMKLLHFVPRLNLVVTDVYLQDDAGLERYRLLLDQLADELLRIYTNGRQMQLNLITDRLFLGEMKNCSAGEHNITLAPNGHFYVCPAFYYDNPDCNVGSVDGDVNLLNPQLYRLDHAPLCLMCDAFQCKRCVWMNSKQTLDVNTPSHQQCVAAHIERNASRRLLMLLNSHGLAKDIENIKEIDYLDPLNKLEQWKRERMWDK